MNFLKNLPSLSKTFHNSFKLLLRDPVTTTVNCYDSFLPPVISRNVTLMQLHKTGPYKRRKSKPNKIMQGNPLVRGIILKTLIRKPKKPNSANRKCVLLKLSNGKEVIAFVPGVGHNLQEHQSVLIEGGYTGDLPGIKVKCVRGCLDLPLISK
ncbi:UNVERIFIED_CONTAM: hypothetical protein PYX00_001897 [Menopon gallinae]|uniref:Small ribosomal subunit protein uS12m n=1 Tax=Menopon gallinae TaxID=328185 RepID=A0AAW2IFW9_9NEOP